MPQQTCVPSVLQALLLVCLRETTVQMSYLELAWCRCAFCLISRKSSRTAIYPDDTSIAGAKCHPVRTPNYHRVAYFWGKVHKLLLVGSLLAGHTALLSNASVFETKPRFDRSRTQDTSLLCWVGGMERNGFVSTAGSKFLFRGPALPVQGDLPSALHCTRVNSSSASRCRFPGTCLSLCFVYLGFFFSSR